MFQFPNRNIFFFQIPEMQKQVTSLSHLCIQLIGMFLGGGLMFVIAIYEHSFHEFLKELD